MLEAIRIHCSRLPRYRVLHYRDNAQQCLWCMRSSPERADVYRRLVCSKKFVTVDHIIQRENVYALCRLFEEIEHHFDSPDVALVDSYRLTEGLGVQIETSSSAPLIVGSFLRQARCHIDDKTLTAQIRTLKESNPIEVSVGNSPTLVLKPGQLHKKSLPELLKADLWNRAVLEKGKLPEVLALVEEHKQVEKNGVKYYFDEDLDWFIQDDADAVTVYGKSEKYGLLKQVREKVDKGSPSAVFESLRTGLEAEINLLEKALSAPSLTQQRRELMVLELATDTVATDFLN